MFSEDIFAALTSRNFWGWTTPFGIFCGVVYVVAISLWFLRGAHHWNTEKLDISIVYEDANGSQVHSKRKQVFTPNRANVMGILSGITSTGNVKAEDWTLTENGKLQRQPQRTLLEFHGKKAISFVCKEGPFPYPRLGVFATQAWIARYYQATVHGSVTYKDAFLAATEYFVCDQKNPVDELCFSVSVPKYRQLPNDGSQLTAWVFRRDNAVLSHRSAPFAVDSSSAHQLKAKITLKKLKKNEVVRFEWNLTDPESSKTD